MRKSYFLAVIIAFVVLLAGCGGNKAESAGKNVAAPAQTFNWKMATCWAPQYHLGDQDHEFLTRLNALVGDEMHIDFFVENALVGAKEVLDAVKDDVVQIGSDFPGYWAGKDTAFNLLSSWPMWMDAYDYINWIYYDKSFAGRMNEEVGKEGSMGEGMKQYKRVYGAFGVEAFPIGPITIESGPRGTKPIRSLADYKGLKIRMSGTAQGEILKKLNAAQVGIQSSEVYQAMTTGVIDAAESCTPYLDWGLGYNETTKYSSHPGWHQPGSMCVLFINKARYNRLPKRIRSAIEIAAQATVCQTLAMEDYTSGLYTNKFKNEVGVKSFKLPEKDLRQLAAWSTEIMYDFASKNPSFAETAYSMAQYMHEYQYWRQLNDVYGHGWADLPLPDLEKLKSFLPVEEVSEEEEPTGWGGIGVGEDPYHMDEGIYEPEFYKQPY